MVKGFLFDLDGVITDTAKLHYKAWKKMANKIGLDIDEEFNETLKGIDRRGSIERILALGENTYSEDEIIKLMDYKNDYYVSLLEGITSDDILPGILGLLKEAKKNGVKVAIASASKNAPLIVDKLEIAEYVDYIANPDEAVYSKPHPAIFELAADGIGLSPKECIAFEDAVAGVQAIKDAGSFSIGIGVEGSNHYVSTTAEIKFEEIKCLSDLSNKMCKSL